MNWEAIGAVGEILGAIAVVATLAYLAIQLRQNTKALHSATYQEITLASAKNNEVLGTNQHLAELTHKSRNGLGALSEIERIQFSAILLSSIRRMESIFVQEQMGAIDPKYTKGLRKSSLSTFAHSGVLEWWRETADAFNDDFKKAVDDAIESGNTKPMHRGLGTSE